MLIGKIVSIDKNGRIIIPKSFGNITGLVDGANAYLIYQRNNNIIDAYKKDEKYILNKDNSSDNVRYQPLIEFIVSPWPKDIINRIMRMEIQLKHVPGAMWFVTRIFELLGFNMLYWEGLGTGVLTVFFDHRNSLEFLDIGKESYKENYNERESYKENYNERESYKENYNERIEKLVENLFSLIVNVYRFRDNIKYTKSRNSDKENKNPINNSYEINNSYIDNNLNKILSLILKIKYIIYSRDPEIKVPPIGIYNFICKTLNCKKDNKYKNTNNKNDFNKIEVFTDEYLEQLCQPRKIDNPVSVRTLVSILNCKYRLRHLRPFFNDVTRNDTDKNNYNETTVFISENSLNIPPELFNNILNLSPPWLPINIKHALLTLDTDFPVLHISVPKYPLFDLILEANSHRNKNPIVGIGVVERISRILRKNKINIWHIRNIVNTGEELKIGNGNRLPFYEKGKIEFIAELPLPEWLKNINPDFKSLINEKDILNIKNYFWSKLESLELQIKNITLNWDFYKENDLSNFKEEYFKSLRLNYLLDHSNNNDIFSLRKQTSFDFTHILRDLFNILYNIEYNYRISILNIISKINTDNKDITKTLNELNILLNEYRKKIIDKILNIFNDVYCYINNKNYINNNNEKNLALLELLKLEYKIICSKRIDKLNKYIEKLFSLINNKFEREIKNNFNNFIECINKVIIPIKLTRNEKSKNNGDELVNLNLKKKIIVLLYEKYFYEIINENINGEMFHIIINTNNDNFIELLNNININLDKILNIISINNLENIIKAIKSIASYTNEEQAENTNDLTIKIFNIIEDIDKKIFNIKKHIEKNIFNTMIHYKNDININEDKNNEDKNIEKIYDAIYNYSFNSSNYDNSKVIKYANIIIPPGTCFFAHSDFPDKVEEQLIHDVKNRLEELNIEVLEGQFTNGYTLDSVTRKRIDRADFVISLLWPRETYKIIKPGREQNFEYIPSEWVTHEETYAIAKGKSLYRLREIHVRKPRYDTDRIDYTFDKFEFTEEPFVAPTWEKALNNLFNEIKKKTFFNMFN